MRAYINPMRMPFETKSPRNGQSTTSVSGSGAANLHAVLQRRLSAVLVCDRRRDRDLLVVAIQGFDVGRVLLGDDPPPELSGPGDLLVVGVELLGKQKEPPDPGRGRQIAVRS